MFEGENAAPGEFDYLLPWENAGLYPGYHRSRQRGAGPVFSEFVPLWQHPDPRRVDVRMTLRDPFETVYVRVFRQRSSVPVYVIADLTGSMDFAGERDKLGVLADFTASAAASAASTGDAFGFVPCGSELEASAVLPAMRSRGVSPALTESLAEMSAGGAGAAGLREAGRYLPRRRALVFLASDFHLPLSEIDTVLASLSRHDVVPIVLWFEAEYANLPRFGLTEVRDLESNTRRLLWLRPGLNERLRRAYEERRKTLTQLFAAWGREPFFLVDGFRPDELTEYFLTHS